MAFKVTYVEASEIHIIGDDGTFKDAAKILEAWGEVCGGLNVNLSVAAHDDRVFVLKLFSNKVNPSDQNEVNARFAYCSAAAQRCVTLQLPKTLENISGEEPLNHYEIQSVTMSFAEALDACILDAEVAARYT